MINSEKCQDGLQFLIDKYNVDADAKLNCNDLMLNFDKSSFPLLPWRNERRFVELKNIVNDGTLEGISVMRVCRIESVDSELRSLIYRELDLCQWILGSKISSIYMVENGEKAANIIAKMESGVVCTIEVAATLPADSKIIDKHEIISQRGIACDRVVDTQVPQESIYLFTDEGEQAYLDVDFELFDYTVEEVALVRQGFAVIRDSKLRVELAESAEYLMNMVDMAIQSAKSNKAMLASGGANQ
ncbi:MAG: hypothetical protein GX783_10745 [Clostridiales bacterium]|nr:hypothetical protein [Clostridiales bacterium]